MIITISGTPGSCKSTAAEMLVKRFGAERIYVGGIWRELARKKGMTLQELTEYAKTHPKTDTDVDKAAANQARKLDKKNKLIIVEGRMQFHFLPESVKIFMKVDPEEGAKRIWKDVQNKTIQEKRNEGVFSTFEAMKKWIQEREEKNAARYKKTYDIDHRDESQYDLILDTTKLTPEETLQKITSFIALYKNKKVRS
ncbi:MAG TPA: AAA family ATPase [Candidatus Nanoarchaeia archaeon]|nr:AAA family ATPase [Candidatus Nanoarchaeia archaeon]